MGHNRSGDVPLRAAFCFIMTIQSLVTVGFGQVLCTNPLSIGELRVKASKKCVDISGGTGSGNVQAHDCDGLDDQQIIICADGTIRNEKANYCFQTTANGDVESSTCSLLNGIPAKQRWRKGDTKTFTDEGGIVQTASEIINEESNKCLDVSGSSGIGNIVVYDCGKADDQYFYVRSRGKELKFGRLRNEASSQCIDVVGSDGRGDMSMYSCQDTTDQWFRFYENGELVNEASRLCVDVSGVTGEGNVVTHPCEDLEDQMWSIPTTYCNGDSCAFVNKHSSNCLDVSGIDGRGNIGAYTCDAMPDQRFTWVADKWTTPTATWNNVGCNQNGKVSQEITNSVTYGSEITSTVSLEVSSTIGANTKFSSASVTVTASASLAVAWSSSRTSSSAITFECENYDNGEKFTRGCMWQLQVDTQHVSSGRDLTWTPQIVKCTSSNTAPVCAPFTKCTDRDCNFCEDL